MNFVFAHNHTLKTKKFAKAIVRMFIHLDPKLNKTYTNLGWMCHVKVVFKKE